MWYVKILNILLSIYIIALNLFKSKYRVKNSTALHRTFNVEPLYLQHENSGSAIDYMHWQIPLSKRFRSLKLWCVLRNYGIKGLQKHIREVRIHYIFHSFL